MVIGMLWMGSNFHAAKEYHIKKYKIVPDTVEVNPLFAKKLGIKGEVDGLKIIENVMIQNGNALIGLSTAKEDIYLNFNAKE